MGRRAGVKDHICVRCGIPSAGFACNDCSRGCDRDMVRAWRIDAEAAWRKRRGHEVRLDQMLAPSA